MSAPVMKTKPSGRRFSRSLGSELMHSLILLACSIISASAGFIDMDTPLDKRTTRSLVDGTTYHLVMSDEFNVPNRSLKDGHDPIWTALDKSDDDASSAGGGSLQFYNSSWVTTENGMLKIATTLGKTEWNRFDHVKKEWKHEKTYYKSGMVQSWNKFCFTGGILEVDVIFPGDPFTGGLWPAVWMLGNLGRATYESSTNMIWPWSYNKCDRDMQPKQLISACNKQNHFGLNPYQGRGATEIDLIEVMTGDSGGPFEQTDPPISLPYGDMTLQIAPGVPTNRPQSGALPAKKTRMYAAQTWYNGLEMQGNTSINPFFYGTYLDKTKPGEPVTRTAKQAFQADAVGAAHQLTPAHFNRTHTFRLEWQPGEGGRVDWFSKGHKINTTLSMEGDGLGQDWVHAYSIKDKSLSDLMGSQIPNEPSYLIMNTAVSSTWGFPYTVPDWCTKCFDCDNPKCACAFNPGFCQMLRQGDVAMYIDSIRVYQSRDPVIGENHTVGCDPPGYPTREYIEGHSYRYMRNPPFSYDDKKPLRKIQRGGGLCYTDSDCGADVRHENLTLLFENGVSQSERRLSESPGGRGKCVARSDLGAMFSSSSSKSKVCSCNEGFTGPHCLAQIFVDDTLSAYKLKTAYSPFDAVGPFRMTPFMLVIVTSMVVLLMGFLIIQVLYEKQRKLPSSESPKIHRPVFNATENSNLVITGTSI